MRYKSTEFSRELSDLLIKYKKSFESDKGGIYVVDNLNINGVMITEPELASEDFRSKLITLIQQ